MKKLWMIALLLSLTLAYQAQPQAGIDLLPCHVKNHPQEVLCSSHTVFENRSSGQGRQIEIQFAVIPAVDENVEPDPVLVFAGGPGQSAIEMAPFIRRVFKEVNERRDVVLIDQRGMGSSHPLECEVPEEEFAHLKVEEQERLAREILEECLEELDADVTLYTQDLANQDIHEIVLALGYTQANLFGASWGTRSALLYAHQFPEQVRTLVLDGNLPLSNKAPYHAADDGERALRELFGDCAKDAHCRQAFPNLQEDYLKAKELLGPDGVRVTLDNPTTGEPLTYHLTQNGFGDVLRGVLYSPELSRIIPLIIQQASQGDYRAMQGVASFLQASSGGSMTLGATLSIFCSEELARLGDDQEVGAGAETLLGDQMIRGLYNGCSVWPKAPIPEIYQEEVGSQAPALLLSGEVDPITPPHWGEEMAKALPNSLHLVATATGHNVAPFGCAPDLIHQFIDQGNLEGIDGSCLTGLTRPSFFIHASGPATQALKTEGEQP